MDYFFEFKPISQIPDSTQNKQSFMQQNDQGFMGQQSIMSSSFQKNTADSIIKTKTKRVYKKKVIKAYKYVDSYLIVKKDSFFCLSNMQTQDFELVNLNKFKVENTLLESLEEPLINTKAIDSIIAVKPVAQEIDTSHIVKVKDSLVAEKIEKQISKPVYTSELEIKRESPTPKEMNSLSGEIWLMGILLFVLFLFAFIKMQFNSKLRLYYQSLTSYQLFNKMFKEQNTITLRLAILLSVVFYINSSLLIYYTLNYLSLTKSSSGFIIYGSTLGLLFMAFLVFASINKLLAFVFESYKVINMYLYNTFYTNRILGVALLPFVVLYPYLPNFSSQILLFLAWIIVLLSFILRWFKGLQISFNYRIPFFYMFLYLCTLEIIPLLFLIKIFLS